MDKTAKHLAKLTFNLSTVYQEKYNKLADSRGLCHAELRCIRILGSSSKMSNKDIAKQMGLSPSRLTRIIRGCLLKGYVNRAINQNDWRALNLSLTRKGRILNQKIQKDFINAHYRILKSIKSKQRKPLINLMEKLVLASEKKFLKRK
jgi:DNA-binding MarR family transcriptional regulator